MAFGGSVKLEKSKITGNKAAGGHGGAGGMGSFLDGVNGLNGYGAGGGVVVDYVAGGSVKLTSDTVIVGNSATVGPNTQGTIGHI